MTAHTAAENARRMAARRKPATQQQAIDAFKNLKAADFDPYAPIRAEFSQADKCELAQLMSEMCGMKWDAMLMETRARARIQARYVLTNVTMAEARMALEHLLTEPKSRAWWEKNGTAGAAARRIVEEVSRMKSKDQNDNDASVYLEYLEDSPQEKARDEANRRRYLEYKE